MEPIASFEPARINFGRVVAGDKVEQTASFSARFEGVKLTEVTSSIPEVTARIIEEDGKPALAITFVAPKEATGYKRANLVAKTDHKEIPEVTLPVTAMISPELFASPANLTFVQPPPGKPRPKRAIRVESASGKPFTIVKAVDPAGNVKAIAEKQGALWRINVEPLSYDSPTGTLELHTDSKDQPKLLITYRIRNPRKVNPRATPKKRSPLKGLDLKAPNTKTP